MMAAAIYIERSNFKRLPRKIPTCGAWETVN